MEWIKLYIFYFVGHISVIIYELGLQIKTKREMDE